MFLGTSSLNDDGNRVFTLIWSFKKGRKRLWCSNYNVVYTDDNRCFKNCATLGVFKYLLSCEEHWCSFQHPESV